MEMVFWYKYWTRMEAKLDPAVSPEFPYNLFELLNVVE